MFICKKRVFLRDTDATGVIYFSVLLQYALEAFEEFLHREKKPLSTLFKKGYFCPIVHTEADYKAPIRVGDELSIELSLIKLSNRSFTIGADFKKIPSLISAGHTKIVHAFVFKGEEVASIIPKELADILEGKSTKHLPLL